MKRWGKISYRVDFKREEVSGSQWERNIELAAKKREFKSVIRYPQLVINAAETDEIIKKLNREKEGKDWILRH